jgi:hypothetical protein
MKFLHVGQEIYHKDTKAQSFFVLTLCLGGEKPVSFWFRLVRVRDNNGLLKRLGWLMPVAMPLSLQFEPGRFAFDHTRIGAVVALKETRRDGRAVQMAKGQCAFSPKPCFLRVMLPG